jgi:predicted nucleotidyltransferase
MNIFDEYTSELLQALLKHEVEFLIVGGYAVNYYGYRRTTGDIDIWIKPNNDLNKKKILTALATLGVEEDKITELNKMDFSKPLVFVDGEEPFKIDFMTYISKVNFEEAYSNKTTAYLEEIKVPFISYQDLILSKFSTGRPQDKLDIDTLQKINNLKRK